MQEKHCALYDITLQIAILAKFVAGQHIFDGATPVRYHVLVEVEAIREVDDARKFVVVNIIVNGRREKMPKDDAVIHPKQMAVFRFS